MANKHELEARASAKSNVTFELIKFMNKCYNFQIFKNIRFQPHNSSFSLKQTVCNQTTFTFVSRKLLVTKHNWRKSPAICWRPNKKLFCFPQNVWNKTIFYLHLKPQIIKLLTTKTHFV